MRRAAQPRHTVGRLVDDQRDRDALEFVVAIDKSAVHVPGDDAHVRPLLDAVQFIGDVTQSADSRRSLHGPHRRAAKVPLARNAHSGHSGRYAVGPVKG